MTAEIASAQTATTQDKPRLITLGDILKSEADRLSRDTIIADNVKIGQLVQHPVRKKYLVALSDSEYGKVLVQPYNCVINLDFVREADIKAASTSVDKFIKEGDEFGIKYIGTPIKDTTTTAGVGG